MLGEPSIWETWLLDNPWPLAGGLVLVGIVLAFNALRKQRPRELRAALAAGVLGLAVVAVSLLVTTDRQRIIQRTRQLVRATAPFDLHALTALFDRDAPLLGPDGSVWIDGGHLLPMLDHTLARWQIRAHWIRQVSAKTTSPDQGVSTVSLRTDLADNPYPGGTSTLWRVTWRRGPDGRWLATSVQWLKWENSEPTEGLWR